MSQPLVQVTCDLLRNSDLGLANIDYVGRWWANLIAPMVEAAGWRLEVVTTEGQGGTFPTSAFVEACGLTAGPDAWEKLFFKTNPPAEAEAILDRHFQGDWVVGPMPPMLSSYLNRRGIPFLDVEFDQIRFARDLFLRARTNDPDLATLFERYPVTDQFLRQEAGLLRARLGWHGPKMEFSPARRIGLFIGQTIGDASLLETDGMREPKDFVAETVEAFAGCDQVLILPHPYMNHTENLDPIREALPNSSYCGLNTYALLGHPAVEVVAGLSSSVLAEAPYFGKRVVQFVRYDHLNLRQFVPEASRNFRLSADGFFRAWSERVTGTPAPPESIATGYTLRESWNLDYSLNLAAKEGILELQSGGRLEFRHVWPTRVMSPAGFVRGNGSGIWKEAGTAWLGLRTNEASRAEFQFFSPSSQTVEIRAGDSAPIGLEAAAACTSEATLELPHGVLDVRISSPEPLGLCEIRSA